jgi:hypothetical protein
VKVRLLGFEKSESRLGIGDPACHEQFRQYLGQAGRFGQLGCSIGMRHIAHPALIGTLEWFSVRQSRAGSAHRAYSSSS